MIFKYKAMKRINFIFLIILFLVPVFSMSQTAKRIKDLTPEVTMSDSLYFVVDKSSYSVLKKIYMSSLKSYIRAGYAPLASPTFTGAPLTTSPSPSDSSFKIPTTAWVKRNAAAAIDLSPYQLIANISTSTTTNSNKYPNWPTMITYVDSAIAGTFISTTNYWQLSAPSHLSPNPDNLHIVYPHIPTITGGTSVPSGYFPVYYNSSSTELVRVQLDVIGHDPLGHLDTITGGDGIYINENASDIIVYLDSISKVTGNLTVKNMGTGKVTILNIEDVPLDTATAGIQLRYGEWATMSAGLGKFISISGTSTTNSVSRYSAYSSGNNNVEVLAYGTGITANLANGNELTFTIPPGVVIISAKIKVYALSSLKVFMGTSDMGNSTTSNRWMPVVQGWRTDSGQPLGALSCLMDTSVYDKFTINGLSSSTTCQIRISF